ncbi:hypothetical protein [Streptomyces caelestis]|uniref:hypothetical protein n=1 Tax=Streptomyces caelestis TaxID=36816 RepID=UPI0036FB0D1B
MSIAALVEAVEQARRQYTRRRIDETLDRFRAGQVGTGRPTERWRVSVGGRDGCRPQQRVVGAYRLARAQGPHVTPAHRHLIGGTAHPGLPGRI